MAATLKASEPGLKIVDELRKRKGWNKHALIWVDQAERIKENENNTKNNINVAALKRFWRRVPINSDVFKSICEVVGANWEEIAESIIEGSNNNYPVFSQYDYTWVGRESLISELLEKLNNNCRLLMLLGITGIGKTALAECLTEKLYVDFLQENSKRFLIENFDDDKKSCDFTSTAIRWLEKWGETIFENDRKDNLILPRLVHKLRDERYLILLDSVEITLEGNEEEGWSDFKDQKWVEFFDAYLSLEDCQSKIIITSQEFPRQINAKYKNFWHDYLLKGLTPLEQLELFDKTGLEVDEDSLNRPYLVRIGKIYEGHPLALKVISGEIGSEKFNGDVSVYWDEYGKEIETVEKAIEEAKTQGIVAGKDDKWRLESFTKELRSRVRKRLEVTFERLRNDSFKAYYLLCAAAIYRIAVKKLWWLDQLDDLDCSEEEKDLAFDLLEDRYLVEFENTLVRQHNLIRSLSLKCSEKLEEEEDI